MTNLLIKLFVKGYKDPTNPTSRVNYGKFASTTGIVCNLLLCAIKGIIGFMFNSTAILADSFNNLSDAGNSIISLIGFKIASKPADRDHPYGHARIEYISCLTVSFLIILLGITMIKTSLGKIINPEPVNTGVLAIVVLIISILIKLWMSLFYTNIGKRINSGVVLANGIDSRNDVLSTSAVLLTTIILMVTNVNLDAYVGLGLAVFIAYSGIKIFRETTDHLLGTPPDKKLVDKMVAKLNSYEGVLGIHDLVIHSYGPDRCFATVHVEVGVDDDIRESHDIIDNIERDFMRDLNINLVIHLDPVVTNDEETNEIKSTVLEIIKDINPDLTMHDFRMVKGNTHSNLIFDVVLPYSVDMTNYELIGKITAEIKKKDNTYFPVITVDSDYIS